MGWVSAVADRARQLIGLPRPITLDLQPMHTFDLAPQPIDKLLTALRNQQGPVGREEALSVPAVQRGRNELCSIATLPLKLYRGLDVLDSPLFRQFDLDVPNVVHLAMTVEDLALERIAWWEVTGQDFDGYPVAVRRIEPCKVTLKRPDGPARPGDERWVWIRTDDDKTWRQVPASLMIRFDSPNPGILVANARAIRIARQLDALTEMYANNPALREYFTDADDPSVDAMSEEEIDSFLAEYGAMRNMRPYGWLPSTVKRADVQSPSPKDLTLVELHQQVMVGIANGLGVDPEDIGVSTTSRTYQNEDARRRDKINRMYAPYIRAITDRLSMGDVTRRGQYVQFDLTDYLKPDPLGQITYWQGLKDMGVTDAKEIRGWAGLSGPPPAQPAPAAADPAPAGQNAGRAVQRFAGAGPAFQFNTTDFAAAPAAPTVDQASRTITGLAVPYNSVANKYGLKYSFRPGSLEYSDPARMAHLKDHSTPVGFHRSVKDSKDGPIVELAVLDGPEGSPAKAERDQLLYDAENGLYSGLSIGVDFSLDPADGDVEIDDDGVYNVVRATWRETSTTYMPAFDDARVTKVAASLTGGTQMDPCPHCGQRHARNIACATFAAQLRNQPPAAAPPQNPAHQQLVPAGAAQVPAWPSSQPPPIPAPPGGYPPDPAALAQHYNALLQQLFGAQPQAAGGPTPVSPHQGPAVVNEPMPYRYDRKGNLRRGTHDFSTDIAAAYNPNYEGTLDGVAAGNRIEAWLKYAFDPEAPRPGRLDPPAAQQQFAITPANVVNLNYPQNHPEMYVDQLDYLYPMYNEFNKGTLDVVTPFVLPKFNSSSGLVADHVTGTEPTPGAFTATAQTITPSALSGKVEMTREVLDQGGNPQASALIWRQMVRGWYEGIETAIQAFLVANAASIPDITLGVAVTDAVMDQTLASAITALQYIRGGDRYTKVFTQIDLYQKLAKAVDTTGRPLYPTFGAMNANGLTGPEQNYLNVRGKTFVPAWATAATGSVLASSWMMDPDVMGVWLSTPQRLDLQWRVAWVDIGIWGYKALAITDFTRTRELTYDPV